MTFIFDPERYAGIPVGHVYREVSDQIERMIEFLDCLDPWDEREEEDEHGDPLEGTHGEGDDCDYEGDGDCDGEPSDNGIADEGGLEEQGLKWAGLDTYHLRTGRAA